jgi:hypothetical protein
LGLNRVLSDAGSIPDKVIGFFNWPNPSSVIMARGSTQPLTEVSTRNLPEGKGRSAHKTYNLTAIYTVSLGINQQGRKADYSPPSSNDVKKDGAMPPLPLHLIGA